MKLELIRTVTSAFTLISVLFVALNYFLARKKANEGSQCAKDKEICEQAIIAIERAYHTLTDRKEDYSLPKPNRINWITTARQILRYNKLKSELKTDLYKLVCSEHEEHWRHQFYQVLQHQDLNNFGYFKGEEFKPFSSENIDPKSALIVVDFSSWSHEIDDPLDEVSKDDFLNDDNTLSGHYGLEQYINELKRERESRRKTT